MKRPNLNFLVDCLGFGGFVLLTATGVLMRYVLPPGSGRSTTIWTLDRHEWGSIHFWIAIAFLAVLALHLFLHWRWIVTLMSGRPRQGSGARLALGIHPHYRSRLHVPGEYRSRREGPCCHRRHRRP